MSTLKQYPFRRGLGLVLAAAFVAGLAAVPASRALAQRSSGTVVPSGTMWCGLTDTGGTVNMQLSSDLRFVEWIDIRNDKAFISTREGQFNGVARAQIADDKFIFRKDREERECEPDRSRGQRERCLQAPCRPGASGGGRPADPPVNCRTTQVNELNVRGRFESPDSVKGNFSAQQQIEVVSSGRGGSAVTKTRLVIGNWVAWPSGSAPCP